MALPFSFTDLVAKPLSEDCPREAFSCLDETVDAWFHQLAWKRHAAFASRTTTLLHADDPVPVAVYARSVKTLKQGEMSRALNEGFFNTLSGLSFPAASIDWLAVRREYQGQGLGRLIMGSILRDFYDAVCVYGVPALVLEAIDQKTEDFYHRLGFRRYGSIPTQRRMLIGAKPVVQSFQQEGG